MRYSILIALLLFFGELSGVLHGQDSGTAAHKLPPGPPVAKWAPASSQWVETTTSVTPPVAAQDAAPQGGSSASQIKPELVVSVVKSGDIRHVTIERGGGEKHELWC